MMAEASAPTYSTALFQISNAGRPLWVRDLYGDAETRRAGCAR